MPVDANALKNFSEAQMAVLDKQRAEAINELIIESGMDYDRAEDFLIDTYGRIPFHYDYSQILYATRFHANSGGSMSARGGLPFMPKLKVGETLVALEAELPKDTEDPNKNLRKQFVARLPGNAERYAWNVNPQSPLYRSLLTYLPQAPCIVRVIRVGEGKNDTRYDVKFEKRIEDAAPSAGTPQ